MSQAITVFLKQQECAENFFSSTKKLSSPPNPNVGPDFWKWVSLKTSSTVMITTKLLSHRISSKTSAHCQADNYYNNKDKLRNASATTR